MDRLPLHVLTGFLGSGKTTLLNRLMRAPALSDSALLINEIGAVSIDHHLVGWMERGDGLDIAVLQGGCTCCAVRGDLVAALRELYRRRAEGVVPPFRRVVLETTGLADPAPVLFTLVGDPVLRHKFAAGAVVATVDALHGAGQLSRYSECRKQIAIADRLVMTKTDLAATEAVADITALLRDINPAAEIFAVHEEIGGLLDAPPVTSASLPYAPATRGNCARAPTADHTPDIRTATISLDEPVDWSAFAVWLSLLLHAHGAGVLRFKAMIDVRGWPNPVVVNSIHHLIHPPIHLPAWPPGPRTSRLVIIAQGLDVDAIERSLRDFLAAEGGRSEPAVAVAVG